MMDELSIIIKDDNKTELLIELLKQFDFVEVTLRQKKVNKNYNFFKSASIWKGHFTNTNELRNKAWKRNYLNYKLTHFKELNIG